MDLVCCRVTPPEATLPTTFRNGDTWGFNSSRGTTSIRFQSTSSRSEIYRSSVICHTHEIEHSAETDGSRSLCQRIGRVLLPPASEVATGFPQSQ